MRVAPRIALFGPSKGIFPIVAWTYRPALDGLRSLAVYLVLFFHAGLAVFKGGFIGVDLFFVLSGFLVSNVILSEIDQTGRLALGKFYARRVRRLLPAAVAVIVATSLVFLLVTPLVHRLPFVRDAQSALLYAANWNFLFKSEDYFSTDVQGSPFLHFWSLSVEEQFYFVFPVLLLLLALAGRRRRWVLPAGVAILFTASLTAQVVWARVNPNWAYYGTDARLYQLMAGALLAVALRMLARTVASAPSNLTAVAGLGAMLLLGSNQLHLSPSNRGIAATVAALMLIGGLMLAETGPLGRLLSMRTPVYLGQISYGTYLWHWPVILVLRELLVLRPITVAVIAAGVSTGLAALSFQVLETPIRSAPRLHPFRWRTVVVGVAASALVASTVVPVILDSTRRPRLAATSAAAATPVSAAVSPEVTMEERNARIPDDLDWAKLTEAPPKLPSCTVTDPTACTLVKGSGPHLLLVGDSHSKVLVDTFAKLAEEHDLSFSVNVVPGCPWQMGVMDRKLSMPRAAKCRNARAGWYDDVLPELDPDVVVFSGMARDEERRWQGRLVRESGHTERLAQLLYDTTRETVRFVRSKGPRVLLLSHMPILRRFEPLECLATATRIHQCEFELPPPAQSDAYNRVTASLMPDVYFANINNAFCVGAPRCLPIVDGVVVWHDSLHFSQEYAMHQRHAIWSVIKRSGALDGI